MDSRVLKSGSQWAVAASIAVLGACGGSAQVKEDQLVRLPAEDRQALMDEQRAVDAAQANLEASRAAVSDAQQFRSIVGDEIKSAEQQLDATQKAAELASAKADSEQETKARERQQLQFQQVTASEAKGNYAESLVSLRQAQEDLRRAELELARARLEREELEALKARGLGEGLDEKEFAQTEQEAQRAYEEARQRVQKMQGQTDAARQTWDDARSQYEASVRRSGVSDVPIGAPPPPEPITTPAAKETPQQKEEQLQRIEQQEQQQEEKLEQRQRRESQQREQEFRQEEEEQRQQEERRQEEMMDPMEEPPTQDVPDTQGQQGRDEPF